jgi:hypothetical protein
MRPYEVWVNTQRFGRQHADFWEATRDAWDAGYAAALAALSAGRCEVCAEACEPCVLCLEALMPLATLHGCWRQVPQADRLRFVTEMLTPTERRALVLGLEEDSMARPRAPRDAPLTEAQVIARLRHLERHWPPTLLLFGGPGSLHLLRKAAHAAQGCVGGIPSSGRLASFQIPTDGGDPSFMENA